MDVPAVRKRNRVFAVQLGTEKGSDLIKMVWLLAQGLPAEPLWPLSNEALAHRHFHDLDDLQTVQAQCWRQLQARPDVIAAYTNFHWWPQSA
jgi:hypothetical protein